MPALFWKKKNEKVKEITHLRAQYNTARMNLPQPNPNSL